MQLEVTHKYRMSSGESRSSTILQAQASMYVAVLANQCLRAASTTVLVSAKPYRPSPVAIRNDRAQDAWQTNIDLPHPTNAVLWYRLCVLETQRHGRRTAADADCLYPPSSWPASDLYNAPGSARRSLPRLLAAAILVPWQDLPTYLACTPDATGTPDASSHLRPVPHAPRSCQAEVSTRQSGASPPPFAIPATSLVPYPIVTTMKSPE